MNLFLLIQSALVAFVGTTARTGKVTLLADRSAIASLGLALAIGWLLVAASSYVWIKTWRAHMMDLGQDLKAATGVTVSSALFAHGRRREAHKRALLPDFLEGFSWFVRPTLVTCCLPLLFIAGWIYLGWYA
jgi:hypothetical protein